MNDNPDRPKWLGTIGVEDCTLILKGLGMAVTNLDSCEDL